MATTVFAINGGDKIKIFDTACVGEVSVLVTATEQIDDGEYWLSPCVTTSPENWTCNCSEIWFETQVNTVNEYGFEIEYEYQVQTSGGSSRSRRRYYIIDNETIMDMPVEVEEIPEEQPEEPPVDIPNITIPTDSIGDLNPVNDTIPIDTIEDKSEVEIEEEGWPWYYYIIPVALIIFIILLVKGRKGKGDGALPVENFPPKVVPTIPPASAVSKAEIPLPPKELPKFKTLRNKRVQIDENANLKIIKEYEASE